jgi:dipeptide transport system substrate-binding protein
VFLQGDLRRVGIGLVIKTYSASAFLGEAKTGGIVYGGRFQMYYGTLGFGGLDEDFSEGLSCAERAPLGDNTSRFCNGRLDMLLAAGVSTFDRSLRKRTYAQEQRLLNSELHRFPLWVVPRIDIYTRRLKNFIPSPNSVTFYHPERWTLSAN